jgi:hypothetical protein
MFTGTDKISEIVNDSDSDSSSFSEISDSDTCTVIHSNYSTINKKFLFYNHTHAHVTQVISVGLFTPHTQFLFQCLGIGSSHYLRCYN